ncbi:hypothetical protein B296_00032855 [Ensete ventricosum]|uniref:Protein kinase domain-containing protein n=1 Tax=Ensete ventricosum TaxID=4639 RepID=A0A426ZTR8_ENSVE|nr:hypothetical protein B296_00032855 [Ensete ventricosum]
MVKATIQQPQQSRAMDAFEKLEKVGEGTYGKVYKARERATGKIVALKKTRLPEDDEGVPPTTLREVSLLRMLSVDPHIVRWCSLNHHDYRTTLVISSLLDLKQGQNKEGQTILYLVFEYMDTDLKKYIRSLRQVHEVIPPKTVKILTLWYRAPEVLLGATHYSTPVDMCKQITELARVPTVEPQELVIGGAYSGSQWVRLAFGEWLRFLKCR